MDVINYINEQNSGRIRRADWQVSAKEFGRVEQGVSSISQSILNVISTRKGSDPFRPRFGSDIWDFIDGDIRSSAANISAAIRRAVNDWVDNIKIKSVTYYFQDSNDEDLFQTIVFQVAWSLLGGGAEAVTDVALGIGEFPAEIEGQQPGQAVVIDVIGTEVEGQVIGIDSMGGVIKI